MEEKEGGRWLKLQSDCFKYLKSKILEEQSPELVGFPFCWLLLARDFEVLIDRDLDVLIVAVAVGALTHVKREYSM